MSHESQVTTDHETIRKWAEERNGKPASVSATSEDDDPGILRIDFPEFGVEESLAEISWDEFFQKFDEKELAFVYQENLKGGEVSRFFKFVNRNQQH